MKRRTVVVISVAAAVVVAGAAVTAWWLLSRPSGAEATASAYLHALATKDGAGAARLVDSASKDLAESFGGATAYLEDPKVVRVDENDTTATARVSFRLDSASHTAALKLHRRDDQWFLDTDAMGAVQATTTIGDAVTIGGATVPVAKPRLLLPAVYPVAAAPAKILVGAAKATVLPGATTTVALTATISPDAATAAGTQLGEYEDRCTATAAAVPAHCGLRVPWAADLGTLESIAYRIDKRPSPTLAPDGKTFAATGGIVVATAKGKTRQGAAATFTYRADDWALRGTVSFSGGQMTLAVE